ncbi:MAG: GNAT family N-acetyltransferase [Candidatus Udaeobacter sp.]
MKIRLAEKSEAEAISRFVSELTVTHIGPTLPVEGLEHLLRDMDEESTMTRMTEGFPYWVALGGGAIVGVAAVKPPSHIYHLFVRSDRQRSGIGRRLMNEALRFISDSGRATVTVNSSLNAVDAYRRFGFRNAGNEVFDGSGVRFQPMSQDFTIAGLLKQA